MGAENELIRPVLDLVKNKTGQTAIVKAIIADPAILPMLLQIMKNDSGTTKFACEKAVRALGEVAPEKLYSCFDDIAAFLDSDNAFLRWGAIITIANLVRVDAGHRFDPIYERYFNRLFSDAMVPAANLAQNAWKIVLAHPEWEKDVTQKLLKTESHVYLYQGAPSPECTSIVLGDVLVSFDHYFAISAHQDLMIGLALKLADHSRKAVATRAKSFLKNHLPAAGPGLTKVEKKAYAKVNLFLNVVGKRPDGYHDLEMINARINLADDLTFYFGGTEPVTIRSNDPFLENRQNLVFEVAIHLIKTYSPASRVTIEITKRIPAGAGLAGNSADAAAVFLGLNELFGWGISLKTLQDIAIRFGADIPYCLEEKPALVQGIGDRITPLDLDLSNYEILVVKPQDFVSTEEVFRQGDQDGFVQHDIGPALAAIRKNDVSELSKYLRNSLEEITFALSPATQEAKASIARSLGSEGLVMTGSGSTMIKIINPKKVNITNFQHQYSDIYWIDIYKFH